MAVKSIGEDGPGESHSAGQLRYLPGMLGFRVDVLQGPVHEGIGQRGEKDGLRPLQLTTPQQLDENDLCQSQRHEIDREPGVDELAIEQRYSPTELRVVGEIVGSKAEQGGEMLCKGMREVTLERIRTPQKSRGSALGRRRQLVSLPAKQQEAIEGI